MYLNFFLHYLDFSEKQESEGSRNDDGREWVVAEENTEPGGRFPSSKWDSHEGTGSGKLNVTGSDGS